MLTAALLTLAFFPYAKAFSNYHAVERLNKLDLPSEVHEVTTEDGYILTMFRIPNPGGTPVLFVHGFLASSDIWLLLPKKEQNIATIVHSAGYDVWMTNYRGNEYSRKHVSLSTSTNNEKYWNFGLHEIGVYDIPAAVDFMLNKTGEESIIYIGHSMGTSVCMVALSERPEYNKKIRAAVLLAPIIFPFYEGRVPFINLLVNSADLAASLFYYLDIYEILGQNIIKNTLIKTFCGLQLSLCSRVYSFLFRQDLDNIIVQDLPYYIEKQSVGTSVQSFQHIANVVGSGLQNFTRYNYGPEKNMMYYGSEYPPRYTIEKITTPIAIFHSESDAFLDNLVLDRIRNILHTIMFDYNVPEPAFQHMDYLYGLNCRELVAPQILNVLSHFSNENLYDESLN
ncbi:lipase 3-like [Cimex lectularius]|uniref:Lipase n=1 Tax=Cimex lectularius TaxID=79782 RepID=A0A8I6RMF2_CIMLE|nr:lipase 3-like [Cimex lectularius]